MTLTPAFGRDYKSKQAVIDDWNAGKDFYATGHGANGYINKNDAPKGVSLTIRYNKLTRIVVVKV